MRNDPRGSCWTQWDLHFHTPASFDYKNKSITNQQIVENLISAGIEAVAVTDHHRMDVERIEELQSLAEGKITVFPGIEFRSELGGKDSVHFIGIFPEDCNVSHIWTTLMGRLGVTYEDIARKGGDEAIYVDFKNGAECIKELGGLISVHAGRKSNSIEEIGNAQAFKRALKSDMLLDFVDMVEVGAVRDEESYREIVFPAIKKHLPIVIGSDNHDVLNYSRKAPCWIKANCTFDGLKHVLHEPEERVFLGDIPPSVAKLKGGDRTKYIRSIAISKLPDSTLPEIWFDCEVPLNSGLVAIIGNKGSGKSALADVMGLLGDSKNGKTFSFLHRDRFCQPKNNRGQHYESTMTWESGGTAKRKLHESVADGTRESVRYLPQAHLESVCNDLSNPDTGSFSVELKSVIFSHVKREDRLEKASLDELIAYKTQETNEAISLCKSDLRLRVAELVGIEKQLSPVHRKSLEEQLAAKKRELVAHDEAKPKSVQKPDDGTPETQSKTEEVERKIEAGQLKIGNIDKEISRLKADKNEHAKNVAAANRLLGRIENFEKQIQKFRIDSEEDCLQLSLKAEDLISIAIKSKDIEAKKAVSESKIAEIERKLAPDDPKALTAALAEASKEVDALRTELDQPNKEYQQYLKDLGEWEKLRKSIIGSKDEPGTVEYLNEQMSALSSLPDHVENKINKCIEIALQIYGHIESLADEYKKLYQPVQQFIEQHPLAEDHFELRFEASIVERGFVEGLLKLIHQSRKGTFNGSDDGRRRAHHLAESADLKNLNGVREFLEGIVYSLRNDVRSDTPAPVSVLDQLRSTASPESLYEFVFGLSYLNPFYTLSWNGKEIGQLSPGERGTLLLVFYLLIDKDDIPLIIDQPEENLDNQTVFNVLVPSLQEAKKRRQIIIVTHNPNLAVVCDADQVVHSALDKNDGNRISYMSGAIENQQINQHLVDILEGTWPAFENRKKKYREATT
ncbi:TrlF family AAA-like ATPase [Bremerella alba]|uniref:Polymerase/histidinol phosphatase N-terminal domain-containing protein n=1 Tax=Bremerella alba TaxID=980252 RepID=A0A7V8V841_9BACT|nr:AAA family ATPase [Bremerella alba]MBA2116725.1 hypothetical protein [Bremerella alba]